MSASHAFTYDSDHEEEEQQYKYDGKEATIFVIDCNKEMFEPIEYDAAEDDEPDAHSRFDVCLGTIESILLKKLRQNNSNEVYSIVLYNTEKADTQSGIVAPDQTTVLFPLQNIDVDMVRVIKNMQHNESEDYMDFANKYGHSEATKVSDILWLCTTVMSTVKVRSLMICWFTDVADPHDKESSLFKEACAKAQELTYLEPDFRLIPLSDDFNFDTFYQTFISRLTGKDKDEVTAPASVDLSDSEKIRTLTDQLLRQDFSHRALSYLTMEISERVKLGIGIYTFTRKKTEPTSVKLDRVTKQVVESRRAYKYGQMPEDDPNEVNLERSIILIDILTADKTIKYLEVGGEKVKFTPLEVYEMKQVMQPKFKLLGFKPLSVFKQDMHIKNPYFIYPSDKAIKGSTAIFRALWEACIRNDKFALGIFTMRLKSLPRVVALIPQQENLATGTYDGFRMEFMPYASDIRDLSQLYCSEESLGENKEELVNACTQVISKCNASFSPSMIKNPANDKVFSLIECSVFNEEKTPIDDHSNPNLEQQDARIGKFVDQIKEMIDGFEEVAVSKRKGSVSENGGRAKKPAVEINNGMILEKCQSGDTKHVTVPMLKEFLKQANVSGISKMGKDDLIAKILELNP